MSRTPKSDEPWSRVVTELRDRGIAFEDGLTDQECRAAEREFDFQFPPDLRAFLQTALPVGDSFPDWRDGDEVTLTEWFEIPWEGVIFDIRHNDFWLDEWGPRPTDVEAAIEVATILIAGAPKLIPIWKHRMMPDEPHEPGNPVFSVHQTDIIHYGYDLIDYLRREFQVAAWWTAPGEPRPIRFWDLDRFQAVRWRHGSCAFDNSKGVLPTTDDDNANPNNP